LPWASFWGGQYLLAIRTFAASHLVRQDWATGKSAEVQQRQEQDANSMAGMQMPGATIAEVSPAAEFRPLNRLVPEAGQFRLPWPVQVAPPSSPDGLWTVHTDTQDRPLRTTLYLNPATGAVVREEPFSQLPLVDRIVDTGVAMHEGQLFGFVNQLIGLTAALGLILLSISAIVMWWRRRQTGVLGAPLPIGKPRWSFALVAAIVVLAVYLPEMAISLALVLVLEKAVFSRIPVVSRWLGLAAA